MRSDTKHSTMSFGPRLLRLPELEKIRVHSTRTRDYAAGVELLGQGVQINLFRHIADQLLSGLCAEDAS